MAKEKKTRSLLTDNHRNQISSDCPSGERLTETIVTDGDEMGESREGGAVVQTDYVVLG